MIYLISAQKIIEDSQIKMSSMDNLISYLKGKKYVGLDSETSSLDPYTSKLLTLQLGDSHDQFIIDTQTVNYKILKELLPDLSCIFLGHNFKFDLKFLLHNLGIMPKKVWDTFLAECVLTTGYSDNERDLSLKGVAKKYLNLNISKDERGKIIWKGLTKDVIIYCATDVMYLEDIMVQQQQKIDEYGLQKIIDMENEVVKVFTRMEYTGIKLDINKWKEIIKEVDTIIEQTEEELDSYILEHKIEKLRKYRNQDTQSNLFFEEKKKKTIINWSSPKQKLQILKDLNIPATSTDISVLIKLREKDKLIPLLIKYNKNNKLATSFGKEFLKFVSPITNRIHYGIWQIINNGRVSFSDPKQNWVLCE